MQVRLQGVSEREPKTNVHYRTIISFFPISQLKTPSEVITFG